MESLQPISRPFSSGGCALEVRQDVDRGKKWKLEETIAGSFAFTDALTKPLTPRNVVGGNDLPRHSERQRDLAPLEVRRRKLDFFQQLVARSAAAIPNERR